MEMENRYASKGVAGTALGLGIGAVGVELLRGGLGGILGGGNGCGCSDDHLINRYEAGQQARIAELETEVKLRDANTYTDSKLLEVYKYFDGRIGCVEHQLADQRVYNATNTAAIGCIQGQIAQLMSLTKLVVPNGSVCPGWGNVTITPAAAPTTGA